jgi:hypothetical protein
MQFLVAIKSTLSRISHIKTRYTKTKDTKMSLQILYQRYTVTGHEKPWMAKLKVIFMKKVIKTKTKKFSTRQELSEWAHEQQDNINKAYNSGGTKGLLDYMGVK